MTTVAESVETRAHLDRVRAEGGTEIQGRLFGRPVPRPEDVARVALLNLHPRGLAATAA